MSAGPTRSVAGLVTAAAVALILASCGSSSSTTSAETSGATVVAPETETTPAGASGASAATQPASAAVQTPGCRHVSTPPSRAGEQASKATARLDPAHSYTVRLATNCGAIVIQLAVSQAPKTTASFAHLVQTGYYNGLTFHRVVPGFVIQGGDPNGDGSGGPSWQLVEPPPASLRYTRGVVAMAKGPTAPSGTSGSQFFIVTGSNTNLPPVYALVGHVVSGEKAVDAISRVPTEAPAEGGAASKPRVPIVIERATLSVR
jgi:peptidyl-prolyl cis-trans isomerase B (cyclophilin B)